MHVSFIQLLIAAFSVGVIAYRTIKFLRREHAQSLFKYIAVVVIWGGIAVFTLFPSLTHWINRRLGLGENLNTLIFIGFIILFLLFFRMLSIIEHIETTVTELIRKDALRDLTVHKKKKNS